MQVIIGVSVVLGLGFLALVFEYMRSNTASLREYNIELQVRQEEREKHKPLEAVEWLQHLLGAKQGTIRVTQGRRTQPGLASMRTGQQAKPAHTRNATHSQPALGGEQRPDRVSPVETVIPAAASVMSAPATAAARSGEPPTVPARPAPAPAAGSSEAPAASIRRPSPMEVARPIQTKPIDVPSLVSAAPMAASPIPSGAESNELGNERRPALVLENTSATRPPAGHRSLLAEGRARADQDRTATASNLLATLPMPDWLRKEQEEKAAARARRESSVQKTNELVEVALQRLRSGSSALATASASGPVTAPDGLQDKANSADRAGAAARANVIGSASVMGSVGAGATNIVPSAQSSTASLREPLKETAPASATSQTALDPAAPFLVELSPAGRAGTDQDSAEQVTAKPQLATVHSPQVAVSTAQSPDSFWNYRGLLDQVVAATGERTPQQAPVSEIHSEIHEVAPSGPVAGENAQEQASPVPEPQAPAPELTAVALPKAPAAEIPAHRDAIPELVIVEVAETSNSERLGPAQRHEARGRVLPAAALVRDEMERLDEAERGDDLTDPLHTSNGVMKIATVTMDVPEHPMQDAVDSETEQFEEPLVLLVEESPRQGFTTGIASSAAAEERPQTAGPLESLNAVSMEHFTTDDTPTLSTPVTASFLPQAPAIEKESRLNAESGWSHALPVENASGEANTLISGETEAVQPAAQGPVEETGPSEPDAPTPLEAQPPVIAREDSNGFAADTIAPMEPLSLPGGLHPPAVLDELLKSTAVVNGVVVVIGINDYSLHAEQMGKAAMQEWMASVETMIRSLLGENDFGCRSSEDEFVLVFPGETGTAAQRRLNTISERLWSFQLRSLGAFSVMFSWGAVEIQGETLADATASASERMYQTKRNRKTVSLDSGRSRKAVNL